MPNSTLLATVLGSLLSGGGLAVVFKWMIDRKIAAVTVKQKEASLAEQIGSSASGWIEQQDRRVAELQRDLEAARKETAAVRLDSAREVQQLREEVGRLSQELNAFRLGIAAPLGYVIVPRVIWEQARARDRLRGELPATSFPGEDVEAIVRDIKDPPEGGGV
jgi:hypothetical protein